MKDRTSNPDLPAGAQVQVNIYSKLIANPSGKEEWVHLVSQQDFEPQQAMALYAQRYSRIENDIRDLKVTLNLEQIRAQSDAMVRKEILCGMVAYNMVVQLRRQGAKQAKVAPKRISFRRALDTLDLFCFPLARTRWRIGRSDISKRSIWYPKTYFPSDRAEAFRVRRIPRDPNRVSLRNEKRKTPTRHPPKYQKQIRK